MVQSSNTKTSLQKVLDLKPTQFAVGMLEVEEKLKIVKAFTKKELRLYVENNPIPVVFGPDKNLYLVDHHHFLAVCYHLGIKRVHTTVVKDLSHLKMSYTQFWRWMFRTRNAYPFCQFGEGPRKALYLPKDVRGLADDPYRSLAWYVRKAGAFKNSERNFAEFRWANYFRKKKLLDRDGIAGMPKALIRAAELAQSPEAKDLPGYGRLKLEQREKVLKKLKKLPAVLK